jgi:hypothetical protein
MTRQVQRGVWNTHLYDLREAAGLTMNQALHIAWNEISEANEKHRLDKRMLERYEKNWPEEKADAVFLAALAKAYEVKLSEMSVLAAARMEGLAALTKRSRWSGESAGHQLAMTAA